MISIYYGGQKQWHDACTVLLLRNLDVTEWDTVALRLVFSIITTFYI